MALPPAPPAPTVRRSDHTDTYHGQVVTDPYRWLEDADSPETRAFVEAQNTRTRRVLGALPERAKLLERLGELWDFPRRSAVWQEGGAFFQLRNSGLQNQFVLYTMDSPTDEGWVLLDPNALSQDGTVALSGLAVSRDASRLAYAVSQGGSDWQEWRVRDVSSGQDLPDVLPDSKFSGASWLPDGSGFFYARYDRPEDGQRLSGANLNQRLWLHRLDTGQDADELILERPDQPEWGFGSTVTEDGQWLIINVWKGTARQNLIWVRPIGENGAFQEVVAEFGASFQFVGNEGSRLYFLTDDHAPLGRLISHDLQTGERQDIVPEGQHRLLGAELISGGFVLHTLEDASSRLTLVDRHGQNARSVPLPGLGTVDALNGHSDSHEIFLSFTSFLFPATGYRLDAADGSLTPVWAPELAADLGGYEVRQEFAASADGTRVPLFIVARRNLTLDGSHPTLLYGYGGFDVSLTPAFDVSRLAWLEAGGVLAVANLRGGGEYGERWHRAGTRERKQNVFDDFAACARFLVTRGYTSPPHLGIEGGSNGGLLVGATLTQHPELIGAAVAHVGVMDLLRFQRFTIGWAWVSDYGSSDDAQDFAVLRAYSPLHNLTPLAYPPTLLTTGDHDDRVVPAHSYKFAAELQRVQQGEAPILLRVQTQAGHGAGKPTRLVLEEKADVYAFLLSALS
ncbi:prolyl oligopeptidase family serine peptidase [Deinococcus humi]|uniref:prolyl oligopeptidase n=1 Tax=Deinococcus humi TaxID=662880 RepID=A0A7W8JTX5_9DEIO|nr:prolyl oligopeptidase family serine peptidase [Deinococcus humi]MBB5362890.1 prolyl oligopeptidase [Deinococcus humi]GGO25805.1 prolyl endopeptidase [Deinococcus humi]